jgi:hypothetical protein
MKLKIGIDMDGVVANFNAPYIDLIFKYSGVRLPAPSDTYPDKWYYEVDAGMQKSRTSEMWQEIKSTPDFWLNVPAYSDAPSFLRSLQDLEIFEDADVYFVTNRMGIAVKGQTENWLMQNGYNKFPTVLISQYKGLSAAALELTHYLDDKNENCTDVRDLSPKTKGYMLKRPYNIEQQGVPRIDSLQAFLEVLGEDVKNG